MSNRITLPASAPTAPAPASAAPASPPAAPAAGIAGLGAALAAGGWTPSALERTLARRLATAATGTGLLTASALREAFHEGTEAFLRENGGHLAALLATGLAAIEADGSDPAAAALPALLRRIES
ncbi:hypothetical protein OG455_08850 [Kitasatospora sp. NBC_01287]|uniref:hypothetical protein n=1 Tax=Kitasatospora sp. NBC_01287 TaxID=2903573 RepID=UPI00225292AC|nr:hypothetical protein [Kitasatospora sp. NBC_01287]MCX4745627.1 hypothetical protein [Kitasatospora sp. NBC_01287]